MRRYLIWLAALAALAGLLVIPGQAAPPAAGRDATVIAVVDSNFNPYHWDFLASRMPQHRDRDRSNDLPLTKAPHEWLSGFPSPRTFAGYERFPITLPSNDPDQQVTEPASEDADRWTDFDNSTATDPHYHWIPGTKFIGLLDFNTGASSPLSSTSGHGVGTTSVSAGNLHGTCPECLIVFVRYGGDSEEAALRWAMAQPWIDVVTNSYGHGTGKIYDGPSRVEQRDASLRGQTVVFSAGNGMENAYVVPNHTYLSSQKGPDWLVTVGAVAPRSKGSYLGAGKMVDVAGVGSEYPAAYGSTTVSGGGDGFGGTSNAAPTVAGTYARALHLARRDLAGPSRIQKHGVIAVGRPYACGSKRRDCELKDGKLTAVELRTRLFHAARHTAAGVTTSYDTVATPAAGEEEFMNEGHGSFLARLNGDGDWRAEFERVLAPLEGRAAVLARPAQERAWMIVDSYCKQKVFGRWTGGYYVEGKTALPAPDPTTPMRNAMLAACQGLPEED